MSAKRYVCSTILVLSLVCPAAAAADVPETFTYTGNLQKDGDPYDGMVSATFRLYDSETDGEIVWEESIATLQVDSGQFVAELGSKNSFDETFDGKDLWLAVTVNGTTLAPRNHIGSLSYAHRAEVADSAENATTVGGKEVSEIESSAAENVDARDVAYDNSDSNLSATDAKSAIDEVAALQAEIDDLRTKLKNKADASSTYTKSKVDNRLADEADASSTYTKSKVDNRLADKADASSTYTTNEVDNRLADKADAASKYTETETDTKLAAKADSSSVYSKTQADSTFATKTELGNYYTKTNADDKFTNRVAPLEDKTQNMSAAGAETTFTGDDVFFEGVNVHVLNGTGSTSSTNGEGNLIVG